LRRLPRAALDWLFPLEAGEGTGDAAAAAPGPADWLVRAEWEPLPPSSRAEIPAEPALVAPEGLIRASSLGDEPLAATSALLQLAQGGLAGGVGNGSGQASAPLWLLLDTPENPALTGALDGFAKAAALEQSQRQWLRIHLLPGAEADEGGRGGGGELGGFIKLEGGGSRSADGGGGVVPAVQGFLDILEGVGQGSSIRDKGAPAIEMSAAVRQFMETTSAEEKVAMFFVDRSRMRYLAPARARRPVQCGASAVLCPRLTCSGCPEQLQGRRDARGDLVFRVRREDGRGHRRGGAVVCACAVGEFCKRNVAVTSVLDFPFADAVVPWGLNLSGDKRLLERIYCFGTVRMTRIACAG
jgi:hypothetical protein